MMRPAQAAPASAASARSSLANLSLDAAPAEAASAAAPAPPHARGKKRAPPVQNVLGKAIAIVGTEPQRFCDITRHPCPVVPPTQHIALKCCWEIQIEANEYPTNPKGIVNLSGRSFPSTMAVLKILYLMGYLVNTTLQPREVVLQGDPDEKGKRATYKTKEKSDSKVCVTFERVPHKDDPNVYVAYRWRFREYGPEYSPSMITHLTSLMSDNAARNSKSMHTGGSAKSRYQPAQDEWMPSRINMGGWIALCEFHRPSLRVEAMVEAKRGEQHRTEPNDIYSKTNRYWPTNAFNPRENLDVARALGADPRYCDPETYCAGDGFRGTLQRFAEDGKNVWEIDPSALEPAVLHDFHMPFQRVNPLSSMAERKRFMRVYKIAPEYAHDVFDATRNNSTRLSEENDIAALARRIENERGELLFKHRKNKAEKGHRHDDVEDAFYPEQEALKHGKWLSAFKEIINPQGNCPPSIQRIVESLDGYLEMNDHKLSIPQGQLFRNLPRFSNNMITLTILLNEVMTVATEHQSCILFLYSALHVYSRVLLQCHHLMLGPPGIGKSFALLMLEQLLIPDTFRKYSYITPKGLAIPGKSQASLVMIIEDGQPSLLGVSGGSGGKPTQASSDIEALIKQFLTSTQLQIQSVTMEPKRAGEFVKCETGCIMFIAMNDTSNLFPKAILARFCVTLGAAFSNSESSDAATRMMAMSERDASTIIKNVKQEFKLFFNRKQEMFMYIFHMETVGMLHPIDTSVADFVFGVMANFAELRGLRMTAQRDVVRYRNLVRSFVIENACDLVWDSPDAPFRNMTHQDGHFLAVNKYLVSTVEIAVWVIGLMSRMWQDNAYSDLITTMKRLWFKDAAGKIERYKLLDPLRSDGTDPCMDILQPPQQPDGYNAHRHKQQQQVVGAPPAAESNPRGKKARKNAAAAAAASSSQPGIASAFGHSGDARELADACARYDAEMAAYEFNAREAANWGHMSARFGHEIPAFTHLGHQMPKQEDLIRHLATTVGREMTKHYLPNEIAAKISAMTTTNVTVQRQKVARHEYDTDNLGGEDPDMIPDRTILHREDRNQLLIENDCIRLAFPSLEHADSSKDMVMECLREALAVIYGASLQDYDRRVARGDPNPGDPHAYSHFLYGECEQQSDKRYILRTIRISEEEARAVDVQKHSKVFNSAYAQPMTQTVMKSFLRSMDDAYEDPAVLFRLYDAKRPWTIMDTNPDEMAALQRAEALGLSEYDQHKVLPSNDPAVYNKAFREHLIRSGETTYLYPDDFSKHDSTYWADQLKIDPEQFSARRVFEELKERQKQRPSIYDPRMPMPAEAMPSLESPMGVAVSSPAAAAAAVPVDEDDEFEDVDEAGLEAAQGMDLEDEDVHDQDY